MQAIILHKHGKKIGEIQKAFGQENITTLSRTWKPGKKINDELVDTNALVVYCSADDGQIISALPDIKKKKHSLPIVVISEGKREEIKKRALYFGADMYVEKPLEYRDLATQIKNLICKKTTQFDTRMLRAFGIWLDLEHRFARRDKNIIELRNKEFALLEYFIINRGKVLTRNAILDYVWDRNANFASNTVDVHINRLRRKIDDPFAQKLIHTIHCVGYIFEKREGKH